MRIKVYARRAALIAGLVAMVVLAFASSAFAAPRLASLAPLGTLQTLSAGNLTLPPGTRVSGSLSADGEQDWMVPVRKGEQVSLTLQTKTGYTGQAWCSAFDSLAVSATVPPLSDLAIVDGVGSASLSFVVPYDTIMAISVMAPSPAHGSYFLNYTMGDMETTSTITRVSGPNRFDTAVQISRSTFPTGTTTTAIVATGRNFADALAASGLAGSYDCPVLLTEPLKLSAGVDAEITRLGATKVFVIGGPTAVSGDVFAALNHGGRTITRIAGLNRFETAAAISREIRAHESTPSTEVFVVNGLNYPDALAVSPYAFETKSPILLVKTAEVPGVTASEIASMSATQAYVIGGTSTISTATMAALSVDATRVAGSNRFGTAAQAAKFAVANGWATWDHVGLTTGFNFPDALAGGAALGKQGGVLLLTKPQDLVQEPYVALHDSRASVTDVTMFGSTASLFGSVKGACDSALLGTGWVDPYGFTYAPVY